jgi:hypothetical protein
MFSNYQPHPQANNTLRTFACAERRRNVGCLCKRKQKLPDGRYRELSTWWIKYYQNGRAVRESTGTTKETKARKMLRSREGDVEHGIPINPKMGRISFEDAADDILNDYRVNERKSLDGLERGNQPRAHRAQADVFAGR